jgi:hypothetical protein
MPWASVVVAATMIFALLIIFRVSCFPSFIILLLRHLLRARLPGLDPGGRGLVAPENISNGRV